MPFWGHTVVGLVVVGLLGLAAWRLAARTTSGDTVMRLLATAVWAWLGVQVSGLATQLPLPGGADVVAAAVSVVISGLVLWRVRPARPRRSARTDDPSRAMLVAVAAAAVVLAGVMLLRPAIGLDGLGYHLPLPAAWVPQGALGGRPVVIESLPIEAYPVGFELASGWLIAVLGSTAAGMLVAPASLGLLVVGVWALTRRLGGGVAAAWGAVATVALSLPTLLQATQSASDMPAAALLAAGAALAVDGALRVGEEREGPARPPPADVPAAVPAAGSDPGGLAPRAPSASVDGLLVGSCGILLGVGIKTHAACGVLLALLLLWRVRRPVLETLRARPWWLMALGLAVVAGGVWLARNAILHGHPSWPLASTSFGDPVPDAVRPYLDRFVDHPGRMLSIAGDRYLRQVWALPLLLVAAIVAVARGGWTRRIVAVTGLLGVVAWGFAPATGITALAGRSAPDFSASAVRYLGPAIVLLAVAGWSLAPRGRRADRVVAGLAVVVLVVQAGLLVVATDRWLPRPDDATPAIEGLIATGVLLVVLAAIAGRPGLGRVVTRPVALAGAVAVLALLLIAATPGFWSRHAALADTGVPPAPDRAVLTLSAVPAWSLGATGEPGARVVGSCREIERGFAAGRTVAIPTPLVPVDHCALPGPSRIVDGFSVWTPAASS